MEGGVISHQSFLLLIDFFEHAHDYELERERW